MNSVIGSIELEREGATLILTPQRNLCELEFQEIEDEMNEILDSYEVDPSMRNIVVDFGKTDLFGSTALGLFLRLWRSVRDRDGRMAFCNVSVHEKEILTVTSLGGFWPVFPSRNDALEALAS